TRVVESKDPVIRSRPSGEKATELISSEWPSKRPASAPVATSQSRATLSPPAVRAYRPSGEKATAEKNLDATEAAGCVEAPRRRTSAPVAAFQRRTVLSNPLVRTNRPSGEKTAA